MQYSKYRSLYLALIHILALVAMGCKNDLKKDVETLEKQALKLQKEEQALQNKNAVLLGNKEAMGLQNDLETLEKKVSKLRNREQDLYIENTKLKDSLATLKNPPKLGEVFRQVNNTVVKIIYKENSVSGVIVTPEGHVITSIYKDESFEQHDVTIVYGSEEYEPEFVKRDEKKNLVLIKLPKKGNDFPYIKFSFEDLKDGDSIFLMGTWNNNAQATKEYLYATDAGFYYKNLNPHWLGGTYMSLPGTAGGAVLNSNKELVGINAGNAYVENYSVFFSTAFPAKEVKEFIKGHVSDFSGH